MKPTLIILALVLLVVGCGNYTPPKPDDHITELETKIRIQKANHDSLEARVDTLEKHWQRQGAKFK